MIATVVFGLIAVLLSIVTNKAPRLRKYINGTPTVIMNNGRLYRSNMKKAKLDLSEFMMMCREQGYFNPDDIQTAVFEYNGKLTVLPKSNRRPVTPEDMSLTPPMEYIATEIIMDGRVLEENLKRKGLDLIWLKRQLEAQGYKNAKEIFLGVCDDNNKLTLFAFE